MGTVTKLVEAPAVGIQATLGELFTADAALTRLAAERLPIKTAYRLAKLTKLVRAEIELFTAQRNAAIRELGEERDATPAERAQGMDRKVITVLEENVQEFARRMNELTALAVTIEAAPLTVEMLEGISVPAADLLLLGPLLEG